MAAAHPSGPALRRLRALVLCACLDAVRRGVACGAAAGAAPAAACMHAAPPLRGGGGGGRGGGVVGEGGVLAQRLAGDALRAEAEESAQRRALRKKRKERKERRRRRALAVLSLCCVATVPVAAAPRPCRVPRPQGERNVRLSRSARRPGV